MVIQNGRVPTAKGGQYIQQLCKHWAHRLEVQLDGDTGTVRFPDALATLRADAEGLTVAVEAESDEIVERIKDVVARHLDRFAFREAPLPFAWSPG